jgi:hypothetical protein|nr:MAG TPA: hypothetical protein [Caudoviricetes sp.]
MGNVNCLRCHFRHEDNGNCTEVGGFCTAVPAAHCPLLRQYLDTGMTPEAFQSYVVFLQDLIENQKASEALDRFRQLVKADKEGRLVVLPFTSGRTLLCKENIDSPRLMKDVELAIRYCSSCGIVFHMDYNVFCDLVKQGRITAVSEEAEKVLGAKKDE